MEVALGVQLVVVLAGAGSWAVIGWRHREREIPGDWAQISIGPTSGWNLTQAYLRLADMSVGQFDVAAARLTAFW